MFHSISDLRWVSRICSVRPHLGFFSRSRAPIASFTSLTPTSKTIKVIISKYLDRQSFLRAMSTLRPEV